MNKVQLAKRWFENKGFSVRESDEQEDRLLIQVEGYEFELSQGEIDYRAYAEMDILEDNIIAEKYENENLNYEERTKVNRIIMAEICNQ